MIDTQNIKSHYQQKFQKFGIDPRSLLWKTKGAAHQRFRQFWAEIDFNGKSVLDVGCGFGEMGRFLMKRYKNVNYFGVDMVPEFVEAARNLNPGLKFETADYLKNDIPGTFDVVIASGILNSNVSNNMDYRKNAIKKLFGLTKGVFAFNMLGAHPQPENTMESNTWYADSMVVLEYCMSITRRVIMRANYNPKDFTVFMYKTRK